MIKLPFSIDREREARERENLVRRFEVERWKWKSVMIMGLLDHKSKQAQPKSEILYVFGLEFQLQSKLINTTKGASTALTNYSVIQLHHQLFKLMSLA